MGVWFPIPTAKSFTSALWIATATWSLGLSYSPPGSGPADTRLARFVGPDGFPQLQPSSQAEYVSIHYDKDGWEDRLTYRDGKNLPATGPDGAFGRAIGITRVARLPSSSPRRRRDKHDR